LCDFKSRMKGLGSTINGLEGEIHQGFWTLNKGVLFLSGGQTETP
jgi:hypothetical protein